MVLKIHADLEEEPPDKEQASIALSKSAVSGRNFSLLYSHLGMWERFV